MRLVEWEKEEELCLIGGRCFRVVNLHVRWRLKANVRSGWIDRCRGLLRQVNNVFDFRLSIGDSAERNATGESCGVCLWSQMRLQGFLLLENRNDKTHILALGTKIEISEV